MGNSLQEQLKRSGLVDDKQLRKAKGEQRRKRKQGSAEADQAQSVARDVRAAAQEKAARDRELDAQRKAEADARARAAQVRQLVERGRVPREQGEVAYHFTDDKVVRRLHLTPAIHQQVVDGTLAVVRGGDDYELVPDAVAEKIAERDAHCIVVRNKGGGQACGEAGDYEGYDVPDDLMW
jgi:uncharacterized protein YaiL (DUF2058 family)